MPSLHFKGKAEVENHHRQVPLHRLAPRPEFSCPEPNGQPSDNRLIHGDNLLALKALLPEFAGKINCIYIDPPYNTGAESWAYNDNVNAPLLRQWLGKTVDRDDLDRHDNWCCMLFPRLKLLHELLADDGFLAISLDDNEIHHLRAMLDEIFGEQNFRNTLAVRRFDKNLSRQFLEKGLPTLAVGFEHVLIYSKNPSTMLRPVFREASDERKQFGYWKGFWNAADRPTMRYDLLGATPAAGQWKWKKSVADEAVENFREFEKSFAHTMTLEQFWEKTGRTKKFIRRRERLTTGKNQGVEHWIPPSDGILLTSNWTDLIASQTLDEFDLHFASPKNTALVRRILEMLGDENSLVLDCFAGSGTTGQAVLEMNHADGGSRRFILIEIEKFAETITAERLRQVIQGNPNSKKAARREGMGGGLRFFEVIP